MKRIINSKTIQRGLDRRAASEAEAQAKAATLTEEEKNEIQATVLRELTLVCTNRIRLLEKVLGRQLPIRTSAPMGTLIGGVTNEDGSVTGQFPDDHRTFSITVE